MRLKVLGAFGSDGQGQRPSAFLVDDRVLIDAGTVGGALSVPEQTAITHPLLRTHHLDRPWPDFPPHPPRENPVLKLRVLPEEAEARVGDLWATPVLVDHTIPTTGFIVHDGETGFVYSGDTGPTTRIWEVAREMRGLKALVVETAFPNRLDSLARASGH